jgi:hypothetical protein
MNRHFHLSLLRSLLSRHRARKGTVLSTRIQASRWRPSFDALEDRLALSTSTVSLGAAGQFGVLGLQNTQVTNLIAQVNGNEGVSQGGALQNSILSKITGNVSQSSNHEFSGAGKLTGTVATNAALLATIDSSALAASSQAAALTPTQTLGTITHSTTVTGNGGLNVIAINGSIRNSLILTGTSSDVFIVNVSGTADLSGNETLGLAGGVTANHVLYNFSGTGGSINLLTSSAVDGTLLAPHEDFILDGTVNGEIIGGGPEIILLPGTTVNQDPFSAPATSTGPGLEG